MRFTALLTFAALLAPHSALACGGFFCSQQPVLQTAERIVFEHLDDGLVAYVQLEYQGEDPDFAWVIPVPSVPEIEVGVGQAMFDALEAQTKPLFVNAPSAVPPAQDLQTPSLGCGGFGGEPQVLASFVPPPDVTVHQQVKVGPYDVAVLEATEASELNNWLLINGYQVVPGSEPVVQEYLDAGMKLLALKLQNEVGASAVEPIKLSYTGFNTPMIPIKLTAVAATPGLEIITWVFGQGRAVPENFGSTEVELDGVTGEATYETALGRAVDQAGGQAWVTEFAAPTSALESEDPVLRRLLTDHPFVTRLRTELDPLEMTRDPFFAIDPEGAPVSREIELPFSVGLSSGSLLTLLGLCLLIRRRR